MLKKQKQNTITTGVHAYASKYNFVTISSFKTNNYFMSWLLKSFPGSLDGGGYAVI